VGESVHWVCKMRSWGWNQAIHNWQENQLSNGSRGLNAKIKKELAENEGSIVCSNWSVRLDNCVVQK
jgi:hypothetical protein